MIQFPARLLAVRTMWETQNPPGVPFGASGGVLFFLFFEFFETACKFFFPSLMFF